MGEGETVYCVYRYYKRQTTADSIFSNSSTDLESFSGVYM